MLNQQWVEKYGDQVRVHTIEVQVDNASTGKYFFPKDSILDQKEIIGLFLMDNPSDDRYGPLSNAALVPEQTVRNSYLNLKCNNKIVLDQTPLGLFLITDEKGGIQELTLTPGSVTSQTSFITVANVGSSGISLNDVWVLHFCYLDNS